jgi:hypothetical protein
MKQLFALVVICLAFSWGSTAYAQQPGLRVSANSTIVTDGTISLKDQQRIQWFVQDGKPTNAGYAYEFGPVYLVAPNGDKTLLKAKDVVNGPVFHYSVSKTHFQQYPQGFKIQLDQIVRYNPDRSFETLPYSNDDLTIRVVPAAD